MASDRTDASLGRTAPDTTPDRGSPYIVSAVYDWVFFLSSPLVALGLG
jgi:hypothetical protein